VSVAGTRSRLWNAVTLLTVALATAAVAATYPVLSQSYDEPLHLAGGIEWLQYGSLRLNTENPPLARVAIALGPFLTGGRLPDMTVWDPRGPNPPGPIPMGNQVLYRDDHYVKNLTMARIGILPFFWLLIAVVWLWAGGRHDPVSGAVAVIATVTVPAVLAHAGFATTDMPFVATFTAALYGLRRVLAEYRTRTVVAFAGLLGLSILTKFSTLIFFGPACIGLAMASVWERGVAASYKSVRATAWRDHARLGAILIIVIAVVVWTGYRFSFSGISDVSHRLGFRSYLERNGVMPWWATIPVPAPALWHGFLSLRRTVAIGHPAYLLGHIAQFGFWSYYPVALAAKTPIPFFVLCAVGIGNAFRLARRPGTWPYSGAAMAALCIVVAALGSTLNYGSRHVLVVYPLLAISAAWGWRELYRSSRNTAAGAVLACVLAAQAVVAVRAYPDFLSYFNAFAGRDPGRIVVETDLDWGQDLLQLREFVRAHDVRQLHLAYFGTAIPCRLGLGELLPLEPSVRTDGWIAISEVYAREILTIGLRRHPCDERPGRYPPEALRGGYSWLDNYQPVARIGRSIRVYHIDAQ
jgi:hypothetical protein